MTADTLEGRLNAQRRVLIWLVEALPADKREQILAELWEPFPPQDAQEDPGAVPAGTFAMTAAYGAELRAILHTVASAGRAR